MSGCRKTSWPEVQGMPAEAAKQKILYDCPDLEVFLVAKGSTITTDYNPKRVRVFYNDARLVAGTPGIG